MSTLPSEKRIKLDMNIDSPANPADDSKIDHSHNPDESNSLLPFQQFAVDRVLFTSPENKSIGIVGEFSGSTDMGVVIAEKRPLTNTNIRHLFSTSASIARSFENDIYSQYIANCSAGGLGELKVMTVYPATEDHVMKYSSQELHLVCETREDYQSVTKPFIEKQSFSLEWVYNILDGKSEAERVVCKDPDPTVGFVMVPDLKWDQKDVENLYVLAIVNKRGILSMRELNADHLPLLKNVLQKGKQAVFEKYNVPCDQQRVYLHYQPSYYHLHIHFTHLKYAAPKTRIGEAHLLDDIIDNIENVDSDYYAKKTLSFVLKSSSKLWLEYQKK